MKSPCARCAAGAIVLASLAGGALSGLAQAQEAAAPRLLPLSPAARYPVTQVSALDLLWQQPATGQPLVDPTPSPSDIVPAPPLTGPDFDMQWRSGGSLPPDGGKMPPLLAPPLLASPLGCLHNRYIYASGLVMTRDKRGGMVLSTDGGAPVLVFDSPDFDNRWHGGFEIGGGWCFGRERDAALEAVYWGLYSAGRESETFGILDATIDFSQLDNLGVPAHLFATSAAAQRVVHDFDFHSAEIHMIGNGCCGGPLGCGRCGCCNLSRGRFGFGWMAGFRYLHFSENWLFTSDLTDTVFDGSLNELNYQIDLDNNLFGFQMGAGLNYCLTQRLQAYAIGRVGVYGNQVTHRQRVFGFGGDAILNSGDNSGEAYVISDSDTDLAVSGQLDLGGRWAFAENWSFDFGYRVLGLAGVATVQDNIVRNDFQSAPVAGTNTGGSLLLHGGYFGLTYCW